MIEQPGEVDPRDDPAPLLETVGLLTGAAVVVMVFTWLLGRADGSGTAGLLLMFGPMGLVLLHVTAHEVWWRRWWGAAPGALAGLVVYYEGRTTLEDLIGATWAGPVAYVLAWAGFGAVFALASRVPLGVRSGS